MPEIVIFVVFACQQVLNFTELDCHFLAALQIQGFVNFAEAAFAD